MRRKGLSSAGASCHVQVGTNSLNPNWKHLRYSETNHKRGACLFLSGNGRAVWRNSLGMSLRYQSYFFSTLS